MCCKKRKIGHELRTLDNILSRNLMAAARERGVDELTAMHGWILGYLCRNEHKDIFQKDIEAEFKICRSTVTNILKLMEKKGYIKRESVPYDARLKKLVLTDTGRELHEKTKDMIDMLEEQTVALYMALVLTVTVGATTAFAAGDPLSVINNLSTFIFSLIRAIGLILLGFGVVQVGLSLKSHDPSQRANGFLTLAGGVIITFAKEILDLIMA